MIYLLLYIFMFERTQKYKQIRIERYSYRLSTQMAFEYSSQQIYMIAFWYLS